MNKRSCKVTLFYAKEFFSRRDHIFLLNPFNRKIIKSVLPSIHFCSAGFQSTLFSIIERHALETETKKISRSVRFGKALEIFYPPSRQFPEVTHDSWGFALLFTFPSPCPGILSLYLQSHWDTLRTTFPSIKMAPDEDGKRPRHEERVLLLFIGSVSLAATMSPTSFISGISAKRGESASRWKGQRERGRRGDIYVRSPY